MEKHRLRVIFLSNQPNETDFMSNILLTPCPPSGLDVSDMAVCCIFRQDIILEPDILLVAHATAGTVGRIRQPFMTVCLPNLLLFITNALKAC
jgi:hypothetical protein